MKSTIALVLLLAGCASSGGGAAAAGRDVVPCAVDAPAVGGEWKQITAGGATFCVPVAWRAAGSRTWRGDGVTLSWSPDVRAPAREGVEPRRNQVPRSPTRRWSELIGGYDVVMWQMDYLASIRSGAAWTLPAKLTLTGEAASPSGVATLEVVYRTVRFDDGSAR